MTCAPGGKMGVIPWKRAEHEGDGPLEAQSSEKWQLTGHLCCQGESSQASLILEESQDGYIHPSTCLHLT
jgi:hypothetical protein